MYYYNKVISIDLRGIVMEFTIYFGKKCDYAIFLNDYKQIEYLYKKAMEVAENTNESYIKRSHFYYYAYNCHGHIHLNEKNHQEKSLSLIRCAIIFYEKNKSEKENTFTENYHSKYYEVLRVSIGNELDDSGRIISAIDSYNDVFNDNSYEVFINLIISLRKYVSVLKNSDYIHFFDKKILELMDAFYEMGEDFNKFKGLDNYYKLLQNKREHLDDVTFKEMDFSEDSDAIEYRKWVAQNKLALNPLNDIYTDLNVSLDSIYIDSIISKIDESMENKELFLIYNEIKQEYASARFQLYEGINNNEYHYSDFGNKLILDSEYILYSYGVKQIENSYRSIYSIFNRVAYFLNKYNHMEISNKTLSLNKLFNKIEKNEDDSLKKFSCLNGLDWIKKDLYGDNTGDDYKYSVDPKMEKIRKLRNYLEHRLVKVVFYKDEYEATEDVLVISENVLVNNSMYLLKKCRETIILLTLYINQNEAYKKRKLNGENIPPLLLRDYPEDFKVK